MAQLKKNLPLLGFLGIILIIAIIVIKHKDGFTNFPVSAAALGSPVTAYYIDVQYAPPAGAFPTGSVATAIIPDPRLSTRLGSPPTLTAGIISVPFGNTLGSFPLSQHIVYASGSSTITAWVGAPTYNTYAPVPGQFNIVNGNMSIPTTWSTLSQTGRYTGAWDAVNKPRTLARIYFVMASIST